MFKYRLFGFNVLSEIDICLPLSDFVDFDVRFNYIPIRSYIPEQSENSNVYKIIIQDVVDFYVKNGNEIDIVCYNDTMKAIKLYLLGSVFYTLMLQRKIFAIHGSAVLIKDKCFVFTGPSGSGKSTIARGFIERGYKILSDDVSRMKIITDKVNIVPSYSAQKLWEDAIINLNIQDDIDSSLYNEINKYNMNVHDSFFNDEAELGGVVLIVVDDQIEKPELNRMSGHLVMKYLIENIYRYSFISEMGLQKDLFALLGQVYKQIEFYELRRPKNAFSIDDQVNICIEMIEGA